MYRQPFSRHLPAASKHAWPARLGLAFVLSLIAWAAARHARADVITVARPPDTTAAPAYGVNFITSAEEQADAQKFQNGLSTGATLDRWPIYWFYVEHHPNEFGWGGQDAAVQGDVAHGFTTNAILLGTPCFYRTGDPCPGLFPDAPPPGEVALSAPHTGTPQGLYEPVFNNGDVPEPGSLINENNKWARFVHLAVNRYKPGGLLAQANGWPAGVGVTNWEIWNEPDLNIFWDGSVADYARLLKVGYLAARFADPNAAIIFGGLANFEKPNFYHDVLSIYDGDPLAPGRDYFHHILATHSYSHSYQSYYHVWRAGVTLASRGLDKPIWLNENGVPAWDDYPGPVWDPLSPYRARMTEQADFVIQSTLYASYAGADAIFHFQLYDACGNQPGGTDFPPHNGELCGDPNYPICAGDANGLFRNPPDAACFRQHPQPETPRQNYSAFRALTTYFRNVEPLWWQRPGGRQEQIAFYRPDTHERVVGLWTRFGADEIASIPATGGSATLVHPDGITQTLTPANGFYTLTLAGATNQNAPWDPTLYMIGGRTYLLAERDTLPPQVTLTVPEQSGPVFPVLWGGSDGLGGGGVTFDVSVAVDNGPAVPWLVGATTTYAQFYGEPFHIYTFFLVGRDRASNASAPVIASVQTIALDERFYLPFVGRPD